MSNTLGPPPEFAAEFKPRWPGDPGGFSAAQMEAERQRCYALGVAQERERCLLWIFIDGDPDGGAAHAIREGKPIRAGWGLS